MAPADDRSGAFYIYDRKRGRFWLLDLADGVFGGYSRREMRRKIQEFRLLGFAENPARLVPVRHSGGSACRNYVDSRRSDAALPSSITSRRDAELDATGSHNAPRAPRPVVTAARTTCLFP